MCEWKSAGCVPADGRFIDIWYQPENRMISPYRVTDVRWGIYLEPMSPHILVPKEGWLKDAKPLYGSFRYWMLPPKPPAK